MCSMFCGYGLILTLSVVSVPLKGLLKCSLNLSNSQHYSIQYKCMYMNVKARVVYLAVCFLANHILLSDIAILVHIMCRRTPGDLWNLLSALLLSDKTYTFFPPVVKSNIPSDSISSALQVLILYPACVHAFPCHPLLFSHLSLCLSVRDRGVMKSLCPRGNRRHVDWGQC